MPKASSKERCAHGCVGFGSPPRVRMALRQQRGREGSSTLLHGRSLAGPPQTPVLLHRWSPQGPPDASPVRVGFEKGPHLIFAFQALKSAKIKHQ